MGQSAPGSSNSFVLTQMRWEGKSQAHGNALLKCVPSGADGQVHRVADRFALIAAAGELASQHRIVPWKVVEPFAAAKSLFRNWIEQCGGIGAAESSKALSAVRAFIERNPTRFQTSNDAAMERVFNRVGFIVGTAPPNNNYAFLPEAWKEVCVGHNPRLVLEVLKQKGFLKHDRGRLDSEVHIGVLRRSIRVVVVRGAILEGEDE